MFFILTLPFAVQGLVMFVDEFYYHHKRGLGRWERWGHPLDTLTVLCCFAVLVFAPTTPFFVILYLIFASFSCVFVTKDEFVHSKECDAGEQWLHALLFILHPVIMIAGGVCWLVSDAGNALGQSLLKYFNAPEVPTWIHSMLVGQFVLVCAFGAYQFVYWNILQPRKNIRALM